MGAYAEEKQRQLDIRYLKMARIWAENSYCVRRQVGALIVKDNMIIADGYNGTPSGFENSCDVGKQLRWRYALCHHFALYGVLEADYSGGYQACGILGEVPQYRGVGYPLEGGCRVGASATRIDSKCKMQNAECKIKMLLKQSLVSN